MNSGMRPNLCRSSGRIARDRRPTEDHSTRNDERSYFDRTDAGSSMIRCAMTGTIGSTSVRCSAIVASVCSGSKRRRSTILSPRAATRARGARSPTRGTSATPRTAESPVVQRHAVQVAEDRRPAASSAAARALRRPGRARRQQDLATRLRRRVRLGAVGGLQRVVDAALPRPAPGDEAGHVLVGDELRELLVVDDRLHALTRDDVLQLRPRERRVQQQRVGPELRRRDQRVDEVAMVATQHADAVTGADARRGQRVGQPVRVVVQLGVRDRAGLVDQTDRVAVANRVRGDAAGRRPVPLPLRLRRADELARMLGPEQAGADERRRVVDDDGS